MSESEKTKSSPNSTMPTGIVVLGLPRSGTTLLRRVLNAHPSIACGGETFLLRATAQFLEGDSIVDGIDYGVIGGLQSAGFSTDEILTRLRTLAFSFLQDYAENRGKPRWASKTAVDSFYVAELDELYGDHVKFICLLRQGLDSVCSLGDLCDANEVFIKELHKYIVRYSRPAEAFAHAWCDVTADLLDLSHRRPETTLLCRYEDLASAPEKTLTEILDFLGEDFDEDLISRAMSGERVQGLGDWKTYARAGIDTTSIDRWKSLRPDVVSRLGQIMNPLLERCGYERVPVEPLPEHGEAIRRYELSMMFNAVRATGDVDED